MAARKKQVIEEVEEKTEEQESTPLEETPEEERQFWSDDKVQGQGEQDTHSASSGQAASGAQEEQEVETAEEEQEAEEPESSDTQDREASDAQQSPYQSSGIPESPGISGPSKAGNNFVKIGVVVLLALGAIGAGFWWFTSRPSEEVLSETTSVETPTPEPVATEQVNFADYSVSILNGSGTPGEAGKVQELLEAEGFEEFETGNAKSYTYKTTLVSFVPDTPDEVKDKIKKVLGEVYEVEEGDEEDAESEFDILIIVGSTKAAE